MHSPLFAVCARIFHSSSVQMFFPSVKRIAVTGLDEVQLNPEPKGITTGIAVIALDYLLLFFNSSREDDIREGSE